MAKTWQQIGADALARAIDREIMCKILLKPPFMDSRVKPRLFEGSPELVYFKDVLN